MAKKIFGIITCLTAWFAVALQYYLKLESTANFISYFTILCNLLVAIGLSFTLLNPASWAGRFFGSLSVQTATALYIFIVFVVYNTVLRGLLVLAGWQYFVDNLLHVVVPLLYVLYWFLFVPKGPLYVKNGFYWLIFPALYLCYSLVRGAVINWYPYPFLNAGRFGYTKVAFNIVIMLGVFLVVGFAFIASKRAGKKATLA